MFGKRDTVEYIRSEDHHKAIDKLKNKIRDLEIVIAEYADRMSDQYSTATYAINWHQMEPFSIERMLVNGVAKTVLGYLDEAGSIKEWTLYCSHAMHEKLVEEFRQYVKESTNEQLQNPRLGGV
jgi:hypothetical protein